MAKNVKVILTLEDKQFSKGVKKAERDVKKFGDTGKESVGKLDGAFKALGAAIAVGSIIDFANQAVNLQNRLRGVSSSAEESAAAFKLVSQIATDTRSSIGDVGDLFANLTVATADMGKTQAEVAKISSTFSKTLKISGADANASSGAIRQFGQALASGVLRGDEFNSIMEANPVFMRKVADELGVTIGEMRALAFEGALTADVITLATEDMADAVDTQFGTTVSTIAESFQELQTQLVKLFADIETNTGAFSKISGLILLLAENVEFLAKMFAVAFAVAVSQRIVTTALAVVQLAKAFQAAAVAGTLLQGVTGVGLVKVAAGVAAASAAVIGMNSLFDDSIEGIEELSDAGKDIDLNLPTKPDQTIPGGTPGDPDAGAPSRAALALKAAREKVALEKEGKKATTATAAAQKRLLTQITTNLAKSKEVLETNKATLQNSLAELELEQEMFGLGEKEKEQRREVAGLEGERRDAIAEITALQLAVDPVESARLQAEEIQKINDLYDVQIGKIKAVQDANSTSAMSFGVGWKEAFANFSDHVADEAAYAGDLFNTATQGFENSILTFVETGKLSFKGLFQSLLADIIKMQANRIFMSLFNPSGGIFAGLFAEGGYIPAGQFGIAGEAGPEIVNGPARVTSTADSASILGGSGGSTNITYNISAVDTQSFRQALSRDPQYIYNLTQAGARRVPR